MCVDDLDCGGGDMQCVNGRCEFRCRDDADCSLIGQVCRDERCVDDDGGMNQADACDAPDVIIADQPVQGSTAGLGSNHVASCGSQAASSEVAYVFRAPAAGPVCITTAQSEFDTVLHVREAACADGVEVACNDDDGAAFGIAQAQNSTIELNAVQNTAYYIFVDGYGRNSSGNYVLEVRGNACDAPWGEGPTDCLAHGRSRQVRLLWDIPQTVMIITRVAAPATARVSIPVSVPFAGRLCASTVGSDFDTVLYVRDGQCADGMELSCNDDIAFEHPLAGCLRCSSQYGLLPLRRCLCQRWEFSIGIDRGRLSLRTAIPRETGQIHWT